MGTCLNVINSGQCMVYDRSHSPHLCFVPSPGTIPCIFPLPLGLSGAVGMAGYRVGSG